MRQARVWAFLYIIRLIETFRRPVSGSLVTMMPAVTYGAGVVLAVGHERQLVDVRLVPDLDDLLAGSVAHDDRLHAPLAAAHELPHDVLGLGIEDHGQHLARTEHVGGHGQIVAFDVLEEHGLAQPLDLLGHGRELEAGFDLLRDSL